MGAKKIADTVKNEILDMIREVARLNKNRLSLPIVKGKYLRLISNRADMQSKEKCQRSKSNNRQRSIVVMVKDWNNENIYVAFIGYIWYCLFRELSV